MQNNFNSIVTKTGSIDSIEKISLNFDKIETRICQSVSCDDLAGVDSLLNFMRASLAYVANASGQLEADFGRCVVEVVKEMPEDLFKRVKNSSTILNQYVAGEYPQIAKEKYRAKILISSIKAGITEYATMVAAYRKEMEMEGIRAKYGVKRD